MRGIYIGKKCIGKILSVVLCMTALLAVISALLFLLAEAGHVCEDDDCPICACMQMCEEQLHRLGESLTAVSVCLFVFGCTFCVFGSVRGLLINDTPVSRKVRLNN